MKMNYANIKAPFLIVMNLIACMRTYITGKPLQFCIPTQLFWEEPSAFFGKSYCSHE